MFHLFPCGALSSPSNRVFFIKNKSFSNDALMFISKIMEQNFIAEKKRDVCYGMK